MRIVTAAGVAVMLVLCALRRHDLAVAIGSVPPEALGALTALHVVSLAVRLEAWRLSLCALSGAPPSRAAIHAANAGAFVAGSLEAHAAMPARVALLRELPPAPADVATAPRVRGVSAQITCDSQRLASPATGVCGPTRAIRGYDRTPPVGRSPRCCETRAPYGGSRAASAELHGPQPPLTPSLGAMAANRPRRRRTANRRSGQAAAPARATRRPGSG